METDLFKGYAEAVTQAPAPRVFLGISKPSQALRAMVDGLKEADARKDFTVDMMYFGKRGVTRGHCYGCAATCALQKASGVKFTGENISGRWDRAQAVGASVDDVESFEEAMDSARTGDLCELFDFFGMDRPRGTHAGFYLTTETWRDDLPAVERLIAEMERRGV